MLSADRHSTQKHLLYAVKVEDRPSDQSLTGSSACSCSFLQQQSSDIETNTLTEHLLSVPALKEETLTGKHKTQAKALWPEVSVLQELVFLLFVGSGGEDSSYRSVQRASPRRRQTGEPMVAHPALMLQDTAGQCTNRWS